LKVEEQSHEDLVRHGGRPTREQAARVDTRLLEAATRLFIEHGFDGTSMRALAEAAGMGKPTVYSRYNNKRDLFEAALTARINDWLLPLLEEAESLQNDAASVNLDAALHRLSRVILSNSLKPEAAAFQRLLVEQRLQAADPFTFNQVWERTVDAVDGVIHVYEARGEIEIRDAKLAAELFLSLVMGLTLPSTLYGVELDSDRLEERRAEAVRLFVRGAKIT
jgi:AcrR family transcriptional regulator